MPSPQLLPSRLLGNELARDPLVTPPDTEDTDDRVGSITYSITLLHHVVTKKPPSRGSSATLFKIACYRSRCKIESSSRSSRRCITPSRPEELPTWAPNGEVPC